MVRAKDGLLFNYEQYKQAFRAAAQSRGIDPDRGASEFQACLIRAEINVDLHHSRQRELVRAAAARQVEQAKRGVFWEEGRGFLRDDAQRTLDEELVVKAESASWWQEMHPDDWKPGAGSSYVERQAMTPIRRNARARKFTEVGEAMREVLTEKPTQTDMKVKYLLYEKAESERNETLASLP